MGRVSNDLSIVAWQLKCENRCSLSPKRSSRVGEDNETSSGNAGENVQQTVLVCCGTKTKVWIQHKMWAIMRTGLMAEVMGVDTRLK